MTIDEVIVDVMENTTTGEVRVALGLSDQDWHLIKLALEGMNELIDKVPEAKAAFPEDAAEIKVRSAMITAAIAEGAKHVEEVRAERN